MPFTNVMLPFEPKEVNLAVVIVVDKPLPNPKLLLAPEAVVAPVIANALLEKLGGDHLDEILQRLNLYRENIRNTFRA